MNRVSYILVMVDFMNLTSDVQYLVRTDEVFFLLTITPRFIRLTATNLFRRSRSSSERINDSFIPTLKHLANRQQLHKRRYLYVISQLPSPSHTNPSVFK